MTKRSKRLYVAFAITSFLLNVAPVAVYAIIALVKSTLVYEKLALGFTVFTVLIMSLVAWVNKMAMRSRLWVLLIGLYIGLDYILTPLLILAACQVIDELIITPLKKAYKNKYTIHKELDQRL